MLLAVDVGNSTVIMGCIKDGKIIAQEHSVTDSSEIEISYAEKIKSLSSRIAPERINGVIISSVVPLMTEVLRNAVMTAVGLNPLIVNAKLKYNFTIGVKCPESLGSDRIADTQAGIAQYGAPLIIVDMGTATTISVINKNRVFIGGLILPGMRTAMDSLINSTAQLPQIKLPKRAETIIGNDTVSAIQNGIIYGNAACLDGLLDRISEELGYNPRVAATGGNMSAILPFCRHEITADKNLILKGLDLIFENNRKDFENAQR